jgi:two-component system cell cycle sensor histidine kinase/response regulator CckA
MTDPALAERILDSLKDAVFVVALDGEVVRSWNRGAEALYGWSAADVLGHSSDLLHTRYLGEVTPEQVLATLTRQQCWRGEVLQRHRDGHDLLLEASLSCLRDASDKPTGIIMTCREICGTCELFQTAFEHLPDALSIFDLEGRIVRINAAGARRLARPKHEIVGRRAEEMAPEVVAAQHTTILQRAVATGEPQTTEFTMVGTTGRHTFEFRYVPLRDPQGQPAHILGVTRDLSERAEAVAAVRASEAKLRAIFDNTQAAHYLVDSDYRILAFNRVVERLIRQLMHREVAIGDSILEYVAPANMAAFVDHFQRALRGEASHYERCVNYGAGGKWYELSYSPVRGADDSIVGVAFSGLDVTARMHAEASLRLRDRAISASSTGIVIVDAVLPELPIIYVNPACEHITGYSAAELLGRNCRVLGGKGTDPAARAEIREALAAGRGCNVTIRNYRKDGSPFWNELQISPVRDDAGSLTHFIGVQADVSERVALEAELRHSQKLDTLGRLAGGIAHDFNNLLTVIGGASSFAHELLPPEHPVQLELAEISQASEHAAVLTRQLLSSARKQSVTPVSLDLNALLVELQRMLRRLIAESIELYLHLAPGLAPVRADATQLEQVLVNLAVNASDAMSAGGLLEISTGNLHLAAKDPAWPGLAPGDYVTIEVQDSGPGMSPEIQAQIFEPFFTTKGPGLGTGLGLSTCHAIVCQHGGQILCDSAPGQGTCFRIVLPADTNAVVPRPPAEVEVTLPHGDESVLLVEDDDLVRAFALRVLTGLGYRVSTARNGVQAIVMLAARPTLAIDLLLTDVVMPELGGPELAAYLQSERPTLRVLYISGYHEPKGPRIEPLLAKPFSRFDLARRVRAVLDA